MSNQQNSPECVLPSQAVVWTLY